MLYLNKKIKNIVYNVILKTLYPFINEYKKQLNKKSKDDTKKVFLVTFKYMGAKVLFTAHRTKNEADFFLDYFKAAPFASQYSNLLEVEEHFPAPEMYEKILQDAKFKPAIWH